MKTSTQFFTFGKQKKDRLKLQNGSLFGPITLAYETYGTLSPTKNNAILVFHALSGSQHAAGINPSVPNIGDKWTEECQTGWWYKFIGPSKAIDTKKYFVICANYLGGCYGSTGPSSINPKTGQVYGSKFPRITIKDIVDSQIRLLDYLGIHQLHAVIGGSLGGFLALTLATSYANRVRNVVSIASGYRTTVLQRIHNLEQIMAIENDPNFNGGDYYASAAPDHGLALARIIAHKTYISLHTLENRARREINQPTDNLSWYNLSHALESYLIHQGKKFIHRFDANTYLLILEAWQRFDILKDSGVKKLNSLLKACKKQSFLIFSINSDVCFYQDEQLELVNALHECNIPTQYITVHSDKGHDAFLLEPELLEPYLVYSLNNIP